MKRLLLIILTAFGLLQLACYKDKGNYDYKTIAIPEVTGIDSLYKVFLGDTVIIKPTVTSTDPNAKFGYTWRVTFSRTFSDTTITGSPFRLVFSFEPAVYDVRLTITDSSNGMKYFRDFRIDGQTQFSVGHLVLSQEGNTSQLSFVKPDSTVLPRIYKALHGKDLPGKPLQVIDVIHSFITTNPDLGYWITSSDVNDGGVRLNNSTLLQYSTLRKNFFDMPAAAKPGYLECAANGYLQGVINGKLYAGAWQTYFGSEVYGMFAEPTPGDYELYNRVAYNKVDSYITGYDVNRKQFVVFTNYGNTAAYVGTGYLVKNTVAFDPKNVGLDLIHFQQLKEQNCFAFGKAADGTLMELAFGTKFAGVLEMDPLYMRPFAQPSLITPTTKWAGTTKEIFYFTSGDKIYRYNPTNQDIRPLTTDFGGKAVSMVKVVDENTLIAGVEGAVYYLDVSNGKLGDVLIKYTGIPGAPVDVIKTKKS